MYNDRFYGDVESGSGIVPSGEVSSGTDTGHGEVHWWYVVLACSIGALSLLLIVFALYKMCASMIAKRRSDSRRHLFGAHPGEPGVLRLGGDNNV